MAKDSRKRKRAVTVSRATKSSRTCAGTSAEQVARPDDPSGDEEEEEGGQTKSARKTKNSKKNKIDPAVDDVINADGRLIGCRRQPLIAVFQDAMSVTSHLECDPTTPEGCARCRPAPVQLCCDIHNPELKQLNISELPTAKPPAVGRRSNLPASVEMDERDKALEYDIEIWRRNKTTEIYGVACLKHEGPGLVMAGAVRERIIKCAHFGKIKTAANLERETRWSGSHEYGSEIIKIVEKHYPPESLPLPSSSQVRPPLQVSIPQIGNQPRVPLQVPRTKRVITCSVCNQPGHNSMYS